MTRAAPPPTPLIAGSTTPIAKAVATAASTALPPARSISSPAAAASGCMAVTMPCSATASRFSISHWLCVRSIAPGPSVQRFPRLGLPQSADRRCAAPLRETIHLKEEESCVRGSASSLAGTALPSSVTALSPKVPSEGKTGLLRAIHRFPLGVYKQLYSVMVVSSPRSAQAISANLWPYAQLPAIPSILHPLSI